MTDPVKAKIVELVPARGFIGTCPECDFVSRYGMEDYHYPDCTRDRSITLADVLRAIGKTGKLIAVDSSGFFMSQYGSNGSWQPHRETWNLTTDYDGQTQEVKDFIGRLIGV